MQLGKKRVRAKRYIKILLHKFRFTYEDISKSTGIEVDRLKAINKKEEPTPEESMRIGKMAMEMTEMRAKDIGDTSE